MADTTPRLESITLSVVLEHRGLRHQWAVFWWEGGRFSVISRVGFDGHISPWAGNSSDLIDEGFNSEVDFMGEADGAITIDELLETTSVEALQASPPADWTVTDWRKIAYPVPDGIPVHTCC